MVIHDFNGVSSSGSPSKTDAPLIVDSNRVQAGALTFQGFQSVTRRGSQIGDFLGGVKLN
jgi:hypothetical protein